jgi:putative transposase
MRWINHNISKNIVSNFDGNKIVMENLKGIRKIRRGKRMNYWISNWSFFQLQSFVQYKAERLGIEVVKVNPFMTSQICHKCGRIGSRSSGCFSCDHCSLVSYSADLNSALNLAHPMLVERQAVVTQPYIEAIDLKGVLPNSTASEAIDKSLTL